METSKTEKQRVDYRKTGKMYRVIVWGDGYVVWGAECAQKKHLLDLAASAGFKVSKNPTWVKE